MPHLELPTLEQRHWDLIGLALVGFAAFFACVFYLGWAGGEVGEALADAILFMFGGVGYGAPVLLFAAGALIVIRPMIPAVHPFRTGDALFRRRSDARPGCRLARPRPWRHAARRLPRRLVPRAPRRARGRVAVLGLGQALLDRRVAHPVHLPAAGGRAAAHRRLDSRDRDRHARRRDHHQRARAPHHRDGAGPVRAAPLDRPAGARRPRAGGARDARGDAGDGRVRRVRAGARTRARLRRGVRPLECPRLRGSDPFSRGD